VVTRVAVCILLLAAALPCAARAAAPDLAKNPRALESVPMEHRPIWRWWWPTGDVDPAELDAELEAMKAAGFGGVEQVLLRNPNQWWSAAFRAHTKHAIEKATALGMRFDTTLGPEWPISSKAVDDVSKGLSMQEAIFSATQVAGGSRYSGPLPQFDDNGLRGRTLVAVTAAKPLNQAVPSPVAGSQAVVLDPATAVDLTPKVSNGVLTWDAPPGRWTLVATWMRPTGQRVHGDALTLAAALAEQNLPFNVPDVAGLIGPLVPDHFSRPAIDATLDDYDRTLFGGDMTAVLRRNGGHVFEDSLELVHDGPGIPLPSPTDSCFVCTHRFWTPSFLAEFRKRRGYDLTPLLPVVFTSFDLPGGGGARVRADYERTLSELLVDNHYRPIRAWANARGLKSRAQGYNLAGIDKTHISTKLQLPDAESLDSGETGDAVTPGSRGADVILDDYRQIVSAAHLSGATEVTLEAGANITGEYDMSVDDYKVIADRAYAAGITTMALHGFAYRNYRDVYQTWSWPGWSAFNFLFAESWSQAHPALAKWDGLAGYYGRISAALQSGRPRVDITVLSRQRDAHAYGSADLASALHDSDFTWDRIDDISLGELPTPRGRRILASGPAYRALVVDAMPSISLAAAKKVLAIARRKIPVVIRGDVPARGTSYRDAAGEDAAIKRTFDALRKLPNVRRVDTGKDAVGALVELRVAADLGRGGLPIVAQHRRTAGGDVWFLYNNSRKRARGALTFIATGRPLRIDLWTGQASRIATYRTRRGATTLPIDLQAGQTALVAFRRRAKRTLHATSAEGEVVYAGRTLALRDTSGGTRVARLSNGRRRTVRLPELPAPLRLGGPWSLSVKTVGPGGEGRVDLRLDTLTDWRQISQLLSASGTGTYRTTLTLPDGWLARGRGVLLDLGQIGGMLELEINGRRAPVASLSDRPRDITALLRPGMNELEATVATTVTNVITGRAQSGDVRYVLFAKNAKQPYGLIGPVTLIPLAQARLR